MKFSSPASITVEVEEQEAELLGRIADLCTAIQEVIRRPEVKVVTTHMAEASFFTIDEICAIHAFCRVLRRGSRDPITIEASKQ